MLHLNGSERKSGKEIVSTNYKYITSSYPKRVRKMSKNAIAL